MSSSSSLYSSSHIATLIHLDYTPYLLHLFFYNSLFLSFKVGKRLFLPPIKFVDFYSSALASTSHLSRQQPTAQDYFMRKQNTGISSSVTSSWLRDSKSSSHCHWKFSSFNNRTSHSTTRKAEGLTAQVRIRGIENSQKEAEITSPCSSCYLLCRSAFALLAARFLLRHCPFVRMPLRCQYHTATSGFHMALTGFGLKRPTPKKRGWLSAENSAVPSKRAEGREVTP